MQPVQYNGKKVKQLYRLVDQRLGRTLRDLDLTGSQSFVLGYLVQNQDRSLCPRNLEEAFSLSHPTVSGILFRLEGKGFLSFQDDKKDRRCKRIVVLPKAVTSHQRVQRTIESMEEQMVQGFTPDQRDAFSRLLTQAIENLGGETRAFPPEEVPV